MAIKICKLLIGIKCILFILMAIKFYSHGHKATFLDVIFQIVCVTGINLKSKVVIIVLMNSN